MGTKHVWLVAFAIGATTSLSRAQAPSGVASSPPTAEPPRPTPVQSSAEMHPCLEALRVSTGCSSAFGIRGSASTTHGVPAQNGVGLMVSSEGENFTQWPVMNVHGVHRLALGGGGAGLEGALLGGLTGGFRLPVSENHGPVFRAGAFGYLRGNESFYASLLELPRVEVGYQLTYPTVVFEIGLSSGAVLTGRHRIGDAYTRQIGSGLEIGGYAAARVPWLRASLSAVRLPSADEIATPVRVLEGTLCALAFPMAICADTRISVADEIAHDGAFVSQAQSFNTGLVVGFTN